MRKTKFQNDYYYHIYNRGVDKRKIFMCEKDYLRFLVSMREFNDVKITGSLYVKNYLEKQAKKGAKLPIGSLAPTTPLTKIISWALLPNHFHLLVKQLTDNGITKFFHKLSGGYTNYFNKKHNRSGSLFQGTFKSIPVKSDSYLLQLSCYINGNPEIHKISKAENWQYSSYQDYLGKRNGNLCDKNVILKDFKNILEYKDLVDIVIKESKQKKSDIRKYVLE